MPQKRKIIRATTIPLSLDIFCKDMLKELSSQYDILAVSSPGEELDRVAAREGVAIAKVAMQRHIAPFHDFISLLKLIRLFYREKPWIVHSMTPKAGLLCMIAAKLCHVPHRIHTFTGLIWPTASGLKRKILIATDKLLCSCATIIIPEGNGVKQDLLSARITSKPLNVLANGNVRGIDLNHYRLSDEVVQQAKGLRKDNTITYIFIGRLVADKGITELVNAFVKLNQLHDNTRLLLVGPKEQTISPLPSHILQTIESHKSIEAVGMQHDIRPWLAAADVFVFPSYREGFPNVVIEAGAMALPSIVTDINGSNEIIIEGKNGLIIPSHDSDSLFNSMLRLYSDASLRQSLSRNARDLIADRFDCHLVRKALYDLYSSLK
ncbi:MAG: glycosyltransferase family 4 protein [Muribaculaceae bacterium]|nr:glycosyltransferase family 4 protein [Muribaculaceae bacterium]